MKQLGGCCFILVLLFIILCLSSASGCPTCACRAAGTRLVQGSGDARGSEQKGRRRGNSVTSTRTTYAVATMCPPCSCPEPAKLASNRNRRSTHPAPDTASSAGSKLSLYTIEMTFEMALSKVVFESKEDDFRSVAFSAGNLKTGVTVGIVHIVEISLRRREAGASGVGVRVDVDITVAGRYASKRFAGLLTRERFSSELQGAGFPPPSFVSGPALVASVDEPLPLTTPLPSPASLPQEILGTTMQYVIGVSIVGCFAVLLCGCMLIKLIGMKRQTVQVVPMPTLSSTKPTQVHKREREYESSSYNPEPPRSPGKPLPDRETVSPVRLPNRAVDTASGNSSEPSAVPSGAPAAHQEPTDAAEPPPKKEHLYGLESLYGLPAGRHLRVPGSESRKLKLKPLRKIPVSRGGRTNPEIREQIRGLGLRHDKAWSDQPTFEGDKDRGGMITAK